MQAFEQRLLELAQANGGPNSSDSSEKPGPDTTNSIKVTSESDSKTSDSSASNSTTASSESLNESTNNANSNPLSGLLKPPPSASERESESQLEDLCRTLLNQLKSADSGVGKAGTDSSDSNK